MQTAEPTMTEPTTTAATVKGSRYAKCIEASKRVRWDIDADVIRGRKFELTDMFLPDGLSLVRELEFLNDAERRFLSQIQGRSYANIFGLVERYINAKILELSQQRRFGDQIELEALVRFTDEELKHQELFRRIEAMIAEDMPDGYSFLPSPNEVARVVLGKSTWAVLGLTCHIELFTQLHYVESIQPAENLSALYKDVFLHHWREESQHAILDELEWRREDLKLSEGDRDAAVDDLIALVVAVDGILQMQSAADADYFLRCADTRFSDAEVERIKAQLLKAYRWQYILSGANFPRFTRILGELTTPAQQSRIAAALSSLA
jgi:hypothetical protein